MRDEECVYFAFCEAFFVSLFLCFFAFGDGVVLLCFARSGCAGAAAILFVCGSGGRLMCFEVCYFALLNLDLSQRNRSNVEWLRRVAVELMGLRCRRVLNEGFCRCACNAFAPQRSNGVGS